MADAALTAPPRETKCLRQFRADPQEFKAWMIAGAMLGIFAGGYAGTMLWRSHTSAMASIKVPAPVVLSPLVVKYLPNGTTSIRGHYIIPLVKGCTRLVSYMLYRDIPDIIPVTREFVNLSMAHGGAGIEGTAPRFMIWNSAPSDTPAGDWNYIMRVYYACSEIRQENQSRTTPPVTITIPETEWNTP